MSSVIAVGGAHLHANASERARCDYDRIAREILADADQVDRAGTAWCGAAEVLVVRQGGVALIAIHDSAEVSVASARDEQSLRSGSLLFVLHDRH